MVNWKYFFSSYCIVKMMIIIEKLFIFWNMDLLLKIVENLNQSAAPEDSVIFVGKLKKSFDS
jgi:hypothetical protein